MPHRIVVALKRGTRDAHGAQIKKSINEDLGFKVEKVRTIDVYTIDANLKPEELRLLAEELADPIIQEWSIDESLARGFDWLVEVGYRPGVTDNIGRTTTEAARLILGDSFREPAAVYTSRQFLISGELVRSEVEQISTGLLCNSLIQRHRLLDRRAAESGGRIPIEVPRVTDVTKPKTEQINLNVSDEELVHISQ